MKNLKITLKDSDFDDVAARGKIVRILRKERLLGDQFLYRGFPKSKLEHLQKHGLDHALTEPTFASTASELINEGDQDTAVNFALDGGCLAIFSKEGLQPDPAHSDSNCYYAIPSMFPGALVALIILDGYGVGDWETGALEDLYDLDT